MAGLLFCHATIQPNTSVYSGFYHVHAVIPPTPQNGVQGFTGAFPAIRRILPLLCDGVSGYTAMMRHAGAHHSAAAPPAHTRYHRHARTLHRSAQKPYYNKAYKMVQHIADHASPAGSRCFPCPAACDLALCQRSGRAGWHPLPGGAVQWRGGAGGAEPLAALAASLFGLSPDSK